ncbi:unnamed protein product [Cladocopium goreaui]|uniref:Vacuolar protein sorting-associated protein 13 DH-like domain-containing protein n=2 Tax=Cladocopium goreaui TaxID=2562237 RepID=A0A9P1CGS1_9DINO|nr:unnamed protein product [Cladocopium goreaui]
MDGDGSGGNGDSSKAFEMEVTYWHVQGRRHLAFEDELKARVAVRGFFSTCMNPFRHDVYDEFGDATPIAQSECPEYIVEPYGFIVLVESGVRAEALTCRFIADTHFVMNVTSSLLLGVKPIVHILMPPEEPDELNDQSNNDLTGTSPLAHLLQGLKHLKQEKLQEFKLLVQDPDGAGVGTTVPNEESLHISTSLTYVLDRRGSDKAKWRIPFSIPSPKNLVRIMLPNVWQITEILQTNASSYELYVEAEAHIDAPVDKDFRVWCVGAASRPSLEEMEEERRSNSPSSAAQEDAPKRRSCQSSRKLQVLNLCGVPTEVWFEKGSKDRLHKKVLEKDPKPMTIEVPINSALCVGLQQVDLYKSGKARPNLSSFGRCGAPLYALQGIMSSTRADQVQCCLTASLSIGQQGQALLELLPPLELQNATQLPLRLHLYPPYGNESVVSQMGILGFTRSSAALATQKLEAKEAVVPPGGTFQVPLHMLYSGSGQNSGFGKHFWQVVAEAISPPQNQCSLTFAFPLGGSILRSGREELELRRSLGLALETTSITGSDPQKTTLQRFTLLLLPGLRIVNSLPVKLRAMLKRDLLADEACDLEPGGIGDFGRSPFQCELFLSVDGEEPQSLKKQMPTLAEALSCRSKFKELKVDQLQLSSNLLCSLQCSWQPGAGPEIVITGKCLVFNKTGLLLQVSDRELLDAPLAPGHAAVLAPEGEVRIGLGTSQSQAGKQKLTAALPERSQDLELRGFADVQDDERLFSWRLYLVKLQHGRLSLLRKRGEADLSSDPPPIIWHLSGHTRCAAAEPQTTGGVKDCFSVEDPGRGQPLVLHAPDATALRDWLSELNQTVQSLQAEETIDKITKGWDQEGGRCRCAKVPELLHGAWCGNGVPIQVSYAGELMASASNPEQPEKPEVMFFGVQVHTVLSIPRFPGKGITVTPRFILRNSSASFVQVMPGLLPNKNSGIQEPAVSNRVAEIVEEHTGGRDRSVMDVMDFIADPKKDEVEAVWVPPGESLAIFHFPLHCEASQAKDGRKAVALRLPGREPLQLISVADKRPLGLQRVLSSGVIPYRDRSMQTGRLPPRMRGLAQEGRLLCYRWFYLQDFDRGELILSSDCEIFIGLPLSVEGATWLHEEPWKPSEGLYLRRKQGDPDIFMKIFTRQMKAGRCNFDGAGKGCVIFLAQRTDNDYDLHMGKGLPWKGWFGLNNTHEEVVALSSGTAGGIYFMRLSVQVRNSTAFMILSDEPAPYRVENWSDSRTLAVRFRGDDYCEILPPLSWFGFDWPAHAKSQQKDWVLMLEDLRTENKAMYEAHKLGPGDDLELEPTAEVTGDTAELTEAGFKKILVKEDQREMERFTRRVAKDLSSSFAQPSLPSELLQDVGTLSEMRQKMIETRLVEPDKPTLTKRGRERAMLCHQMTTNFVKFLLQSGGFNAKENHIAAFVHESHPLPDLLTLLEKLPEEPWVKKEREAGDAFQDLLAMSDVEHTSNVMHMLIRRVLEDMPPVHPKPSKNAVHTVSKHLAETLRNGQWPATVPQWTHFTEEVRLHCLPEERPRDEAAPLEASDDDAEEEERNARPSHLLSSKSDGALDETMVGKTSPLSQDGFVAVQALNSKQAMSAFVKRMLQEERGEVNDLGGFDGFIESCVHDTNLTFRSLHQDIERGPSWALFLKKPGALHVDRCFDGVSRVFTVRDHKMEDGNDRSSTRGKDKGSSAHFECWDIDVQLAGAQICVVFQAQATSLGCGYVNELDEEIFAVTVDHIQLRKKAKERKIKFAVHHFQIDNLREADRQRPIIVCPEDSGYYSDRRETLKHRKNQKETIPFLYFCIEHVPSGILHFKEFELIMQPVITRLDMEFWIEIGQRLLAWISTANSNAAAAVQGLSSEDRQILENQIRNLREGGIDVPSGKTAKRPIYLEKFRLGALIAQVEFLMPMKKTAKILKQRQAAASGSDSATTLEDAEDQFDAQWLQSMWLSRVLARLTYRSHGLMKTILTFAQRVLVFVITSVGSGVLTSLGHVTPRFALPETRIETEFTDLHVFAMNLFQTYVKHGMWESYKVLGSMNILGDPIGWTLSVGGGVKQFFLKTGSDVMTGEFEGEGFKSLVQGVVGGTAAHVGKFFGALGDTVDALTQTGGQNYLPGNVNHVGDGVIVGTQVFGRHVVSGVTGLVAAPIHGFRNKGWRGLGEGFLKGVRGAVAQPVSGLMHGAQHIADGLDATTRLLDHWGQISVRRSARQLQNSQLLPLTGAEFAPRITVWVDALEFLTMESFVASTFATLGQLRGATYRVLLQAGDWSKACKLGHLAPSGAIQFDQAKWVPIETLLESDLDIIVQDCTLQGHLDYDMQIVYKAKLERKFILNQVAKVLQDPEGLAIFKDYTCRWRPSQSCSVRLDPTSPQSRHPTAKLLLRFWPAWDPVRVPKTQQWVSNGLISNSRRAHPERKEGLLLKKSKGLLHHWSEKWVVLENHEFKYWSDRKDYEQQEAPKAISGSAQSAAVGVAVCGRRDLIFG